LWGAQGGYALCNGVNYTSNSSCGKGGKGGYTSGVIELSAGDKLYVLVGGKGADTIINASSAVSSTGGYNGGGNGSWDQNNSTSTPEASGGGGGATDIRLNGTALSNRIMVAGGGGGASWYNSGGAGGGTSVSSTLGTGASGSGVGSFGVSDGDGGDIGIAGGGGGYYGGNVSTTSVRYGTGGSSYINSSFLKTKNISGANQMPGTNLLTTSLKTGHEGDGFARITYAGKTAPN